MSAIEELEDFLETTSEKVRKNVNVITTESSGINSLLHISKDTNLKQFIPRIGTRQGASEDRTIPRITTAPTILGCLIGYVGSKYDFLELMSDGAKENLGYKGGFIIYDFDYAAALKPNNRLVYDSANSDEHWLVSYSKETVEYNPTKAGKVFYKIIRFVSSSGNLPVEEGTLVVEVIKEEGLMFSKNIHLTKGYYVIEGPVANSKSFWNKDTDFRVDKISEEEYKSYKNESAALLSLEDYKSSLVDKPSYMKW
jgi:hypothetical protein